MALSSALLFLVVGACVAKYKFIKQTLCKSGKKDGSENSDNENNNNNKNEETDHTEITSVFNAKTINNNEDLIIRNNNNNNNKILHFDDENQEKQSNKNENKNNKNSFIYVLTSMFQRKELNAKSNDEVLRYSKEYKNENSFVEKNLNQEELRNMNKNNNKSSDEENESDNDDKSVNSTEWRNKFSENGIPMDGQNYKKYQQLIKEERKNSKENNDKMVIEI
jgi:hypothetical protein